MISAVRSNNGKHCRVLLMSSVRLIPQETNLMAIHNPVVETVFLTALILL